MSNSKFKSNKELLNDADDLVPPTDHDAGESELSMINPLRTNTSKALYPNEIGHANNQESSELIKILVTHADDIKKLM